MKYSKLVHNFLEDSAQKFPQKEAFFANNNWHTYLYIEQNANRLARLFLEAGIKKGQPVAFLIENSIEYVITYYAILKSGAVTVALNTELTSENIAFILTDCAVDTLVTSSKFLKRIKPLFEQSGAMMHLMVWAGPEAAKIPEKASRVTFLPEAAADYPDTPPAVKMIDLDTASIVYTSGSTGKPRGATLSHLNIVTNTRSIVEYLELTPQDRIIVILPFYYIYGKSLLNTHFFAGGSVVVDNRFLYPNVVLKTMQEQEVTGFSGVPSTFSILLHRSNVRSVKIPSLRYVTQAGGAMAPAVQKEVADVFKPARLFIMYGATEASARLSYLDPDDLPRKWGSIGKGIPNVDLFIADKQGTRLPAGEQGEIVARGANIMQGYWNHPEETRKVLKHGLYYTGDLGVMDDEGFLYVVGRSKDMIKIGGNRASAREIEDAIYEFPDVADAAVIGVPDEVLGEAPKAFVVLKNHSTGKQMEEQLLLFLKSKLAAYKIPKMVEFRESLPKNKSGKIQKLKLS